MANSTIFVPMPPYTTPMLTQSGSISEAWARWFNQVYQRIGQAAAPSNNQFTDTTTLQAEVTTLQGQVSSINSQITAINSNASILAKGIANLGVGRQL